MVEILFFSAFGAENEAQTLFYYTDEDSAGTSYMNYLDLCFFFPFAI